MIKGVAFDMDGLMFDTERLTYKIWQSLMDKHNLKYNFDIYKKTVGLRNTETKQLYDSIYGENFNYAYMREQSFKQFWNKVNRNGLPIKKGLINLLDFLKSKNIKIALATSTSSKNALKMLKIADVYSYFDEFVCGDMVKNCKPHPEIFQTAAQKLQLDTSQCIALEDSINGINGICRKNAAYYGTRPAILDR